MTSKEIRDFVLKQIIDDMKISFGIDPTTDSERIAIFVNADTEEKTMKQKAVIDSIVQVLTAEGYEITLNDIDMAQYDGKKSYSQSVILRNFKKEPKK